MPYIVDLTRSKDEAILAPMLPLAKMHKMHLSTKAVTIVDLTGRDENDKNMPPAIPELSAAKPLLGKKLLTSTKPLPAKKKSLVKHMVLSLTLPALPTNFATTATQSDEPDESKPMVLESFGLLSNDDSAESSEFELLLSSDKNESSAGSEFELLLSDGDDSDDESTESSQPAAKAAGKHKDASSTAIVPYVWGGKAAGKRTVVKPTPLAAIYTAPPKIMPIPAPKPSPAKKKNKTTSFSSSTNSFSSSVDDRNSILAACDTRLDELTATWCLFSPDKQEQLLRFPEVVEYARKCLRAIHPGSRKFILQLKCPVPKKNHNKKDISLALGGNCPENMRRGICSIRCADELFGIKLLSQLFVFNCRVECRIDCKSGCCAICSWIEAEALGNVYKVLCVYAHAVGAKIGFISLAGSTTGIGQKLGTNFFEKMTHGDGTPYISEGMYVPNGYHISLGAYYCNKFPTVEMQVNTLATDSTQLL
jgi:hypothetical protein